MMIAFDVSSAVKGDDVGQTALDVFSRKGLFETSTHGLADDVDSVEKDACKELGSSILVWRGQGRQRAGEGTGRWRWGGNRWFITEW